MRAGVYLLPNLFTTGNLCLGFFALMCVINNGSAAIAAMALLGAAILDGIDGRLARLTRTQSSFGLQYDSLADLGSFGIAAAVLFFYWCLSSLGNLGWAMAFFYVTCVALRLARYNTLTLREDKKGQHSRGLTCTVAGMLLATIVWNGSLMGFDGTNLPLAANVGLLLCMGLLALLMVSNIPYMKFGQPLPRRRVPFIRLLAVICIFTVIALNPPFNLFLMTLLYVLSGPVMLLWRRLPALVHP